MYKALQGILTSICLLTLTPTSFGQRALHLKNRDVQTSATAAVAEVSSANPVKTSHLVLQFASQPTAETVAELQSRGIQVLADVPTNGLLVAVQGRVNLRSLGVNHAEVLGATDKTSPLIGAVSASIAASYYIVEFHPDVDLNQARGLLLNVKGIEIVQNPDLNPRHLMVHVIATSENGGSTAQVISTLTAMEEVAYVFPASKALANNIPTGACIGALTTNGASVQSIPTYGEGWDGPGLGSANLTYVFSKLTAQLPAGSQQSEILRAMAEWSKVVKVSWQPGTNATGAKTVNILFASGDHGDGFPFDGQGGVLAHTFYPANPNPEPLAGDMHLDDAESWHIGANTDLYSVALHELGHALGLGHSDNPADVMYPYYKMSTTLSAGDIAAIQTLYAAQTASTTPTTTTTTSTTNTNTNTTTTATTPTAPKTPTTTTPTAPTTPAPAKPVVLTVNTAPTATTGTTLALSGSATGGNGSIAISWTTNTGASGNSAGTSAAWTISNVPLSIGANTVTVIATSAGSTATKTVTVTRQAPVNTPGTAKDTTPPSLTLLSPTSASTGSATYMISGIASDNVGVASITWTTAFGASGTATGTNNWSANIPVMVGVNTVIIRAFDAAGNNTWRTVIVTRH